MKNLILTIAVAIIVAGGSLSLSGLMNAPKAEADSIPADLQVVIIPPHVGHPTQEDIGQNEAVVCQISFLSMKPSDIGKNILIDPPSLFKRQISGYTCKEQQMFAKLGWYESEYNPDAVNTIYTGLFQESDNTRDTCRNNGSGQDDFECAKWVYNHEPQWFETVTTFNF